MFAELGIQLREATSLRRAARGVVLGVKIQDYLLSGVIRQRMHYAVLIRQGKHWRIAANLKHLNLSFHRMIQYCSRQKRLLLSKAEVSRLQVRPQP